MPLITKEPRDGALPPGAAWEQNSSCDIYWWTHNDATRDKEESLGGVTTSGGRWLRSVPTRAERRAAGSDVIECHWSKDTTSPAGVAQITLVNDRVDYRKAILSGDVMLVFMTGDHRSSSRRALAMVHVDRVSEGVAMVNGTETHVTNVSARDLGKVLQETETVFDPALDIMGRNGEFSLQYWQFFKDTLAGSPMETVMRLFSIFYRGSVTTSSIVGRQFLFPGRRFTLAQVMDLKTYVQAPMFGFRLVDTVPLSESGNVWTLLNTMANRVVNEFFVDMRDDLERPAIMTHLERVASMHVESRDGQSQVFTRDDLAGLFADIEFDREVQHYTDYRPRTCLIHRQMPYDADAFNKLPTSFVDETEVSSSMDLGRAGHDVRNFINMRSPVLDAVDQELLVGIHINLESIKRHGIKRLSAETSYPFTSASAANDHKKRGAPETVEAMHALYVSLLAGWNAYNDRYWSGTLSTRLRPDIRVGTKLRLRRTVDRKAVVVDYYVQALNHSFSYSPGASSSTFTLVRGIERNQFDSLPEANTSWQDTFSYGTADNPWQVLSTNGFTDVKGPGAG